MIQLCLDVTNVAANMLANWEFEDLRLEYLGYVAEISSELDSLAATAVQ